MPATITRSAYTIHENEMLRPLGKNLMKHCEPQKYNWEPRKQRSPVKISSWTFPHILRPSVCVGHNSLSIARIAALRQFADHWVNCKQSRTVPFSIIIITIIAYGTFSGCQWPWQSVRSGMESTQGTTSASWLFRPSWWQRKPWSPHSGKMPPPSSRNCLTGVAGSSKCVALITCAWASCCWN